MNATERVVDIVETLAAASGACGVSEISRQLGIGKSSVYRTLAALEDSGWVQQDSETRKYSLTGALARVGFNALSQLDIQEVASPHLHHLQDVTGETSALCLRTDLERVYIDSVPSTHELRQVLTLGKRFNLWYGSAGKVMLAFMPEEEIEAVLAKFMASDDPVVRPSQSAMEALRAELAEIRRQGFSAGLGQRNTQVCSVAAPIFNHEQKVVASLVVSGPLPRFNLELALHCSTLVADEARKISRSLGAEIE